MDGERGPFGGAKPAKTNGPEGLAQTKTSSAASTTNSRHSPVTPLAPLEFLQNQRRGSITDPSLHAAGASGVTNIANSPPSKPPRHDPSATLAKLQSPPYRFGEASGAQPSGSESSSPNLRRILRSPPGLADARGRNERREGDAGQDAARDGIQMEVDTQNVQQGLGKSNAEYESRRPSLAGTKRKMSPDGASASSDIDPQLVGPGVPSGSEEERVPKRRSSAFETHRMEYLNLHDRRNSGEVRVGTPGAVGAGGQGAGAGGGGGQQWWGGGERREAAAATPVFANTPVTAGGYTTTPSSAFAGESPHGRPPPGIATFAWPAANPSADPSQQAQPPQAANEAAMAANSQAPYDPNLAMLPPGTFPQDRRMSVPAIAPENMPVSPASASSRALRSRSRPASRARANQSAGTSTEQSPGPSNSAAEDASLSQFQDRAPGSTPYSRSPELRVSHKLAERKRRKEMKDLFDELRDQLPADRGMKASKWEILSKAIDFIGQLKQSHQEMSRDIDILRHELDGYRQGIPPPFGPGAPVFHPHAPPPVGVQFPPPGPPGPPGQSGPPGPAAPPPHPQHVQPPPPHGAGQQPPLSRPGSSQNMYPPGAVPMPPHANGTSGAPAPDNTS
ncbi:hypothetical protein PsYK624_000850 [Phanerochaete sordida]|uniref:BHLH domain-containing protein n=1 Tax=Phanerochaete sordida TaxID=48140 RepID=A0A9P3L6G5_9APHY|nr:hypothetical protein PsYK624_000850 [Phanerochaete sordida]